jgi:hypothetical protein
MRNLLKEIRYDMIFVRGHTLQPAWFKVLKIYILLGLLAGSLLIFGSRRTLVFFGVFLLLSLIVHLLYRAKTRKFTQSWMDFRVDDEAGVKVFRPIGKLYYSAVLLNAILAVLVSWRMG